MSAGSEQQIEAKATLQRIGSKLADDLGSRIETAIQQIPRKANCIPLVDLERESPRIAPIKRWDPKRYATISGLLDDETAKTKKAIAKRVDRD